MQLAEIVRWAPTILLGLSWLLIAANNVYHAVEAYRSKGSTSLTLCIGGILGAAAMLACPLPVVRPWAWVPAVLDPGSLPALAAFAWGRLRAKQK